MSQQNHDLKGSMVTADNLSIFPPPASPPRRDSMEDADSSLTRKRPRLDDGSSDNRPMLADSPSSSAHYSHYPAEPSREMTIRSQPPLSSQTQENVVDSDTSIDSATMETPHSGPPSVVDEPIDSQQLDGADDVVIDSPPVIAIDDDDDDDYASIRIEYDEEDYFAKFPFAGAQYTGNAYMGALRQMIVHFQGGNALDGTVLPLLTVWLESLPDSPSQWRGYYLEKRQFWDDFATFVNKVLIRRHPFGESFCDETQTEEQIFTAFLRSYVQVCARFLRVDIEYMSRCSHGQVSENDLLSFKHLKHLCTLFRSEKAALYLLLSKEYGADIRGLTRQLMDDFLLASGSADRTRHIFRYAEFVCKTTPGYVNMNLAGPIASIIISLGWHLVVGTNQPQRDRFYRDAIWTFRLYDEELQTPGKVVDVAAAKEAVIQFAALLTELCHWDDKVADKLAEMHLGIGTPNSPSSASVDIETSNRVAVIRQDKSNYRTLISSCWRFKLLMKYVVKGRMELRVMSIGAMDEALVAVWREYHVSELQTRHPVMQYLADFILNEKVVDYIISVDSHPQIISRSGNIVGFLVVTHRYSESQTDAIWKTITRSPDPRVVTASLKMMNSITTLMNPPELYYFFKKLYDLPIEEYSLQTLQLLRDLIHKAQQKPVDLDALDQSSRPWNVCVRLIQDSCPTRDSTKALQNLHLEACDLLHYSASNMDDADRLLICMNCVDQISRHTKKATGGFRTILYFLTNANYFVMSNVLHDQNIVRSILEEVCVFVDTETPKGYHHMYSMALQYRLDLLRSLLIRIPEIIPPDMYTTLWDHTVGKYALNTVFRDWAWAKMLDGIKAITHNDYCRQAIFRYIPTLEPEFFTPGMFELITTYDFKSATIPDGAIGEANDALKFGDDLLWRIVLTSPSETIGDNAAKVLAARYLEVDTARGINLEEVEESHILLAEKCAKQLLLGYRTLRNISSASPGNEDTMDMVLSETERKEEDRRLSRMVVFVKLLLSQIRSKPYFCHSGRSDSKVEILESDLPAEDTIEISYNIPTTNEKQTIVMRTDNTLHDLYTRLCHSTGFTRLNLFAHGQRLQYNEKKASTLADLGLRGKAHLLVQKAAGSETRKPIVDKKAGQSAFEIAFTDHLDELFTCMDSNDSVSAAIFELLLSFAFRDRIINQVLSDERSSRDVFPPGRFYQVRYAAFALQHHLREQARKGSLDDSSLLKAVNTLVEALLDRDLFAGSLSSLQEIELANTLVLVLLEFLKERPCEDVSAVYFSDESAVVDRLVGVLIQSLKNEQDCSALVVNVYSTIIEASLHSRGIWDAFAKHPATHTVHKDLLLVDPRKQIRQAITQAMKSVCGGDLPSTSPLDRVDTASHFWTIIAAILPEAIHYQKQSEQLFAIAEQVFRNHDEHNRNEDSLRACLFAWSDLLLRYKHEEFVGRDDVDFVVLGFTRLLLCCIPSLKSFKKPLSAGPLLIRIFQKFLFVHTEDELPVLESNTRRELYDLVISLADDAYSFKVLLNLAADLTADDQMTLTRSYMVDRSNEIRSGTGYVGLVNPRAICYMNSLLTQLFMNFNFRKFMLELPVADGNGSQQLLSNTQRLFGTMQNTFRKSADPRTFASCVKGLEGTPIDINIQMDADEFYNLLFDQWEGQMLSPEIKQQFRSFYGGQTVNQIKSKECEHVSERVESFFVVQCDVQGKAGLQESLQAFVEGDVMEGDNKYKCESCGGKFVDAVKRTCLKEVPDNLIFHLKRFDFDLVEMRRAKINDLFQFPEAIDISQYHVDHLTDPSKPRQEDMFELVGVLVHQGTSDNGHYYSYIRERPCPADGANNWIEFNDRDVDPFDPASLPYNAFGGSYDEFQRQQKQFSAYMLFYQRRNAIVKDQEEYITSPLCGAPKVQIPPQLESDIKVDNESFVQEYSLHDPNHSRFVRQLLRTLRTVNNGGCSDDHTEETTAIHIALDHICQNICRQRDIEEFEETMLQLRKTALSCPICCRITLKWLATSDVALTIFLLRCMHPKVRSQVRIFLVDALLFLRDKDPASYITEAIDSDMDGAAAAPCGGIFYDIVCRLRAMADESWLSSRGWDDFYLTLCQLASMGHVETAILLNQDFLEFVLKLLSMQANSQFRQAEPDMWKLIEKRRPMFNRTIELVFTLLLSIDLNAPPVGVSAGTVDRLEHFDRRTGKYPLSRFEHHLINMWDDSNRALAVLDKMIEVFDRTKTEIFYPGEVLKLLLTTHDARLQRQLWHTVVEGISSLSPPFSDPYVRAALAYCEASPDTHFVSKIIEAAASSATLLKTHGGDSHLDLLNGLLLIQNKAIFDENGPDFFYDALLQKVRVYAVPLLVYETDLVRKATAAHLEDVFRVMQPAIPSEQILRLKYNIVRRLIGEMASKIVFEHDNHAPRSCMQPMIGSYQMLCQLVLEISQTEDPDMVQYHDPVRDQAILAQYETDVEPRLRNWPLDEGTPNSTGEAYEQSDYGTESDDALDN